MSKWFDTVDRIDRYHHPLYKTRPKVAQKCVHLIIHHRSISSSSHSHFFCFLLYFPSLFSICSFSSLFFLFFLFKLFYWTSKQEQPQCISPLSLPLLLSSPPQHLLVQSIAAPSTLEWQDHMSIPKQIRVWTMGKPTEIRVSLRAPIPSFRPVSHVVMLSSTAVHLLSRARVHLLE